MAFFGTSVEYGLHTLIYLAGSPAAPPSSRDLADLQELPPAFLAKILSKLEKAGIVTASDGIRGGYRLARPAQDISVLEVIDAIEGKKPLFDCNNIRMRCALFDKRRSAEPPATPCDVHAVMLRAEATMRAELAQTSVGSLADAVGSKMPSVFADLVQGWLGERNAGRDSARVAAVRASATTRRGAAPA